MKTIEENSYEYIQQLLGLINGIKGTTITRSRKTNMRRVAEALKVNIDDLLWLNVPHSRLKSPRPHPGKIQIKIGE
jgi:hypothetical protein